MTLHRHSCFLASAPLPKQDVARLRPRIFDPAGESEALPPAMAQWQANLGASAPEAFVIDVPYFYGRGGGSYGFGYTWISQPG